MIYAFGNLLESRAKPRLGGWLAWCFSWVFVPTASCMTVVYALTGLSSSGPVYRSADSGKTWQPTNLSCVAFAVDPRDSNGVYCLSSNGGKKTGTSQGPSLLRSMDGGQTFSSTPFNGLAPIEVDASASNILYVQSTAAPRGIYRSTDSGNTWNLSHAAFNVFAIRTDANAPGVVLAAIQRADNNIELDRSNDYGATWPVSANFPLPFFPYDVAFDGKNPNVVYLASSGPMQRSTDGGKTWQSAGVAGEIGNIVLDARNGNILAGGILDPRGKGAGLVAKSSDGGKTWTTYGNGLGSDGVQVHLDPEEPSVLYANHWRAAIDINNPVAGFYVSTDGGQNWSHNPVAQPSAGTLIGDYMVTSLRVVSDKRAPPAISSVASGASFQPGIVANAWVAISGTAFASETADWSKFIVNGALPTVVDNVSVTMGGKPAYVYFVSPTQLNVLAPDLQPGPINVTVTTGQGSTSSFTTTAGQYGPAFFTWPGNQPVATRQDYSYAAKSGTFAGATTIAAKPGDVLILWGTGFGPTSPTAPAGMAVPVDRTYAATTVPAVTINQASVAVLGAVLSPGSAGLYQVAIQVPATLGDGDWPIQATVGGVQSPAGVMLSVRK